MNDDLGAVGMILSVRVPQKSPDRDADTQCPPLRRSNTERWGNSAGLDTPLELHKSCSHLSAEQPNMPPLRRAISEEIPRWGNSAGHDAPLKIPRLRRGNSERAMKIKESIDFSDHKSPTFCNRQDFQRSKSISRSIHKKLHRSQCQSDGSLRHLMNRRDSRSTEKPAPNATWGDRAPRKPASRSSSFRRATQDKYDVDDVSLGTRSNHRTLLSRQSSISRNLMESIKHIPDVDQAPVIPSRDGSERRSYSFDISEAAYADFESRRKGLTRSKSIERTFYFQMKQHGPRRDTRPKTSSCNEHVTLVCTEDDRHTTVPNAA